MQNGLFFVLLLLLMQMVRFREVDTVPAVIEREQNIPCWAEKIVEVRPKPADGNTGTKAQRES